MNTELIQDYHDRRVFTPRLQYSDSSAAIKLSKTKFLNFGWRLNRGKDKRKTLVGTTKWWPRPLNRGNWSIEVLFTIFY